MLTEADQLVKEVDGHRILEDPAEAARRLENDRVIGFDTETTGLSPFRDQLAVIQLYGDDSGTLAVLQVRDGVVPKPIKDLLSNPTHLFIGHNVVNFDLPFLQTHGVEWRKAKWFDTLVAETVIESTGRRDVRKSLKESVRRRLGLEIDKKIAHGNWGAPVLSAEQLVYAARDVLNLPALMRAQLDKARETRQLKALEMEQELMPLVAEMCINGLPIRTEIFNAHVMEMQALADGLAETLREELKIVNPNSTQQLARGIFEATGVTMTSTAHGAIVDALKDPTKAKAWKILKLIAAFREPSQIAKMYGNNWTERFVLDGWVHARFWQCGTDTNRFSSSDPNLQQWPKSMRKLVGNVDGLKIVSPDYSQIEVRVAAEISHDSRLLQALETADVHRSVAADVYRIQPENVSAGQRKAAKALTFALLFDGTATTLYNHQRESGGDLSYSECSALETAFFDTYQGLKQMRHAAHLAVAKSRRAPIEIRLPNGLRRLLVGANKTPSRILNTMVQGSAGIGIKYGILEAGRKGLVRGYMGAQVHDELVAAVPEKEAEEYGKELAEAMVLGMNKVIKCPVKVGLKINDFWEM